MEDQARPSALRGTWLSKAAALSDRQLLHHVALLARQEREATVELVGYLAELDARKLHRAEGFGSLFAYCRGALRLAEHAAYNRIEAARLSRRFPALLDLLADGSLNLSTARLLAPHLRPDNFDVLVAEARGLSKREVEVLVAGLAPRPDVRATVRRLPTRQVATLPCASSRLAAPLATPAATTVQMLELNGPTATVARAALASAGAAAEPVDRAAAAAAAREREGEPEVTQAAEAWTPSVARGALSQLSLRPSVTPLAPERYRLQATISGATHAKLRHAQELLRREVPDGDPDAILDRALTLLLEDIARRKLAAAAKPRPVEKSVPGVGARRIQSRTRHIPASVKRAVWLRDEGRCAFVAATGRRCSERVYVEFHHCAPYAIGGEATVANISLRCRTHNAYEAELDFGAFVPGQQPCPAPTVAAPEPGLDCSP